MFVRDGIIPFADALFSAAHLDTVDPVIFQTTRYIEGFLGCEASLHIVVAAQFDENR